MPEGAEKTPVVYVSDLSYERFDPADLFDLAFLLRSPDHDLRAACLADGGERVFDALTAQARANVLFVSGAAGLADLLAANPEPINLVVVGGYGVVADLLARDKAFFRAHVARLFLVGGHANTHTPGAAVNVPIDPRLKDRYPERFAPAGDGRVIGEQPAFGALLTSGEGVIWLPRDVCLWRYAAPGVLEDGGPVAEFLLRELFFHNLQAHADRYDAADAPVLVSSLPAFLLARRPDPLLWMRLFRATLARVEADESGVTTAFATRTDAPNLYCVIAIDGQGLGKLFSAGLRDRPLAVTPPS